MSKLDELKKRAAVFKKYEQQVVGVEPSDLQTLIQTVEIAFGMQEPTVRDYTLGYNVCGVCGGREIRGGFLVDHEDWCEWVRIQTLKKELTGE